MLTSLIEYCQVDCITFGTPAITYPALKGTRDPHQIVLGRSKPGLILSYINEGDIVALERWGYIGPLLERMRNPQSRTPIPPHESLEFSGDIILLTDPTKCDKLRSEACEPDYEKLKQTLFVDPLAHRLDEYVKRLESNSVKVRDDEL